MNEQRIRSEALEIQNEISNKIKQDGQTGLALAAGLGTAIGAIAILAIALAKFK